MGFFIIMLISNLFIPILMLLFGIIFVKKTPSKINGFYGYRSSMSMKNMDTWVFAHQYCGRLWKTVGIIMLTVSAIVCVPLFLLDNSGIGIYGSILILIQTFILIASIYPVEKALKKNFDKNGQRRV